MSTAEDGFGRDMPFYCNSYLRCQFLYALLWVTSHFVNNLSLTLFVKNFFMTTTFLIFQPTVILMLPWFLPTVLPISLYVLPFKSKFTIKSCSCNVVSVVTQLIELSVLFCKDWGTRMTNSQDVKKGAGKLKKQDIKQI